MNEEKHTSTTYNQKLGVTILVLTLVIGLRLFQVATQTENLPGFYYSFLHVLIVGGVSFWALRSKI